MVCHAISSVGYQGITEYEVVVVKLQLPPTEYYVTERRPDDVSFGSGHMVYLVQVRKSVQSIQKTVREILTHMTKLCVFTAIFFK